MAENAGAKQPRRGAGRRFRPGQSGNPAGKPRGTRHQITIMAEQMLDGEAESIIRKVIALAKRGDTIALRLCFERICPARRGRLVATELPKMDRAADLVPALGTLIESVAVGKLTLEEANGVASLIELKRKAIETVALEARMTALEQRIQEHGQGT